MKRVLLVTCAFALVFTLGVSPALGAGHAPIHNTPKAAGEAPAAPSLVNPGSLGLASPLSPLSPRPGRIVPMATGHDIPGVELMESDDVSGTVDAAANTDDVFGFFLEKGARIDFHLQLATPGSGIELYVFAPGTTTVADKTPALLGQISHEATTSFMSPADGWYYVDVYARTGSSSYSMPYETFNSPNDNIYPYKNSTTTAPRVTASPMIGSMNAKWDWDDVSSIPLAKSDKLSLFLTPAGTQWDSPTFDLDLYLYPPTATSIYGLDGLHEGWVADSAYDGNPEWLDYTAPSAGTYFIDANAYTSFGYTALVWRVTPARPTVKLSPSGTKLTYKRKKGKVVFTLSARFSNAYSLPYNAATTYLQYSKNGKTKWSNKYKSTTNANGNAGVKFTAKKKSVGYYRWATKVGTVWTYGKVQKVTVK